MEELDVELEDLFKELNIVNMSLQKHSQIDFSTREGNPGGFIGGLKRWWKGENRKDLCIRVRKLVYRVIKALVDYQQSSYYTMHLEKSRVFHGSINKLKLHYQEKGDIDTFSDLEASEKMLELALSKAIIPEPSAPPAAYHI